MDSEIAANPVYLDKRSRFIFWAVEYALYCIAFDDGLEWIVEDPSEG